MYEEGLFLFLPHPLLSLARLSVHLASSYRSDHRPPLWRALARRALPALPARIRAAAPTRAPRAHAPALIVVVGGTRVPCGGRLRHDGLIDEWRQSEPPIIANMLNHDTFPPNTPQFLFFGSSIKDIVIMFEDECETLSQHLLFFTPIFLFVFAHRVGPPHRVRCVGTDAGGGRGETDAAAAAADVGTDDDNDADDDAGERSWIDSVGRDIIVRLIVIFVLVIVIFVLVIVIIDAITLSKRRQANRVRIANFVCISN